MPAKKKKIQSGSSLQIFFVSRAFLLILIVGAVLAITGYIRAYYQDYKIRQEISALQEEIRSLERKKIESLDILEYVMSDSFVEERARTDLNMRAPGERVLIIPDVQLQDKDASIESKKTKDLNNLVKWWYYFTHKKILDTNT